MDGNTVSDQLEEGEIVDDDFEDISDNSINDSACGKLVSPYGNLRALSLSSGSESDRNRSVKHKRKLLRHKCKIKPHRRRKRIRHSSDSSDSDISPPQELKGKLKEAIHVSGLEGAHRNTLEARLKAMGGLAVGTNLTSVSESPPRTLPKKDEINNSLDKVEDTELEELRLEALKTAVINKHQRRKRKKALEGQEVETPLQTQENKENDTPKDEQNENSNCEKAVVNPVDDLDEDEDLLRASLLAGLAKNITKKQIQSENPLQLKQVTPKPATPVPSLPKRSINKFKSNIVNKKIVNKRVINKQVGINKLVQKIALPKPQVKPLIINVNSDSDSEEEIKKRTAISEPKLVVEPTTQTISKPLPQKLNGIPLKHNFVIQKCNSALTKITTISSNLPDLSAITNNVENFLREQREKFETENKNKLQTAKSDKDKTILEKSAVKLLPKSQQIEYQQLLKKLRTAEKIKKAKKLALLNLKGQGVVEKPKPNLLRVEVDQSGPTIEVATTSKNNPASPQIEVVVQPATPLEDKVSNEMDENINGNPAGSQTNSSRDSEISERRRGITNELTLLQKALKEMKMQKNGSLQIKSKYQTLTPVIRKITATSNDRKKQEYRIKALLQELKEARNNLAKSHEKFSNLVKELVTKKEQIDKSHQELKVEKKIENGKIAVDTKNNRVEISLRGDIREIKSVPVTSTPIKSRLEITEETTISTFVTSSTNNECEDMDVCNSDEADICQIDIVDPNDIDQIFKRKPALKSTIPEYVSPLNFNHCERYTNVDPLGIMCPYEVNGSCRDVDCTYKHYLKNDERL